MEDENKLLTKKHALLCFEQKSDDWKYLEDSFCGEILNSFDDIKSLHKDAILFVGGDIQELKSHSEVREHGNLFIIKELSKNYDDFDGFCDSLCKVPLNYTMSDCLFLNYFRKK